MRRAKKVAVPEEEEEEEMDFDEMDMDEHGVNGMTLEDLLSPEEIESLHHLVAAVVAGDLEEVKKIIAGTCYSSHKDRSERVWLRREPPNFCESFPLPSLPLLLWLVAFFRPLPRFLLCFVMSPVDTARK